MSGGLSRRVRVLAAIALCLFIATLAGCGKRNAPTAPPDEPDTYPRA
jgi:predicted small lipoprotein YifL